MQPRSIAGLTEMGPDGVYLGGDELRDHPDAADLPIFNTEARRRRPLQLKIRT
ncbi:MAG: hypothetical protein K6T81_09785 [Alicyclobacillus macrosporangiidus]|uniref:hypothetical protein n=1 Tax=Alicyclobacillus macrosporangiidus TaxID=392015 RepID=UPI0026ECDC0F|nr:hypothetical protein [Alicyclobacillus macrosporangiidus]MCL6599020.1 hypothetical protein [Alicyclobacillus macrosporangiidus]